MVSDIADTKQGVEWYTVELPEEGTATLIIATNDDRSCVEFFPINIEMDEELGDTFEEQQV